MKKTLLLVVFALFLLVSNATADSVGENFEAGGIQLGGSGYYFNNFSGYSEFSITPWVDFYLVDNFSFGLGVSFFTDSTDYNRISVFGNAAYSFVFNPSSPMGFVLKTGFYTGYSNFLNTYSNFYIEPYINAYYYISPRIAPYIGLRAITLNFGNSTNPTVDTYINISFGIAFSIPVKDKTLGAIK